MVITADFFRTPNDIGLIMEPIARLTRQRQIIEDVLARTERPLTPQELLSEAQRELPRLGIATVYRALRVGQDAGSIHPVEVQGAAVRYELANHGHHHHFHCTICSRIFEVHACPGDLQHLAAPGFVVTGHDLTLRGTCSECAKN